jgi:CDP-diacylglycerol--serine O-phosphatidyltransferase
VFGGILDALDGRVARATGTGSRFGEELDSLVDAISFGLAPALIMYFAVLNNESGWDWLLVFLYTACAVMRLARFNVEQAGRDKTHFHGLPSPAAGLTLATYYWFSQTPLYNQTVLAELPWHVMLRFVMLGLGLLMISNVQYPALPTVDFRSTRGIIGFLVVIATILGVIFLPREFFFPALMAYVLWGVARSFVLGLMGRLPNGDTFLEEPGEDTSSPEAIDEDWAAPRRHRRRRRPARRPPDIDPATEERDS